MVKCIRGKDGRPSETAPNYGGGRNKGKTEHVREAVKVAIEQGKNVILPPAPSIAPATDE